jgi:hypothetical protein
LPRPFPIESFDMYRSAINIFAFVLGVLLSVSVVSVASAGDEACSFFDFPNESEELADYVDYQVAIGNVVTTGTWQSVSTWDCADGSHFYAHYGPTSVWEYDHSNFSYECAGGGVISSTADRRRILTFGTTSTSCTSLPPSQPENCTNDIQDGDELGINCGGSCASECVWQCPTGYAYSENIGSCADYDNTVGAYNGNCPDGYAIDSDYPSTCVHTASQQLASPDDPDLVIPVLDIDQVSFYTPSEATTTTTKDVTVVDNGDDTSTKTTTTTSTTTSSSSTAPTTTTTTTTEIIDNTTSAVLSSTTVVSASDPWYADPSGTGDGGAVLSDSLVGVSDEMEGIAGLDSTNFDSSLSDYEPEKSSIPDLFDSFLDNNPLTAVFADTELTTDSPVCSMTWNYKGTDVEFSLCGEPYESTFTYMGNVLVFICTVTGYFIIFGRK